MVKKAKVAKTFSWAFSFKSFHTHTHTHTHIVYSFHALIYGLKFILELKKMELKKILIKMAHLLKMALTLRIHK